MTKSNEKTQFIEKVDSESVILERVDDFNDELHFSNASFSSSKLKQFKSLLGFLRGFFFQHFQ